MGPGSLLAAEYTLLVPWSRSQRGRTLYARNYSPLSSHTSLAHGGRVYLGTPRPALGFSRGLTIQSQGLAPPTPHSLRRSARANSGSWLPGPVAAVRRRA